jgi:hypothetical protein
MPKINFQKRKIGNFSKTTLFLLIYICISKFKDILECPLLLKGGLDCDKYLPTDEEN